MILKVIKKQSLTLSSDRIFFIYILGLRYGFFLNETSVLDFAELAIFHLCLNKNKLRINCLENP